MSCSASARNTTKRTQSRRRSLPPCGWTMNRSKSRQAPQLRTCRASKRSTRPTGSTSQAPKRRLKQSTKSLTATTLLHLKRSWRICKPVKLSLSLPAYLPPSVLTGVYCVCAEWQHIPAEVQEQILSAHQQAQQPGHETQPMLTDEDDDNTESTESTESAESTESTDPDTTQTLESSQSQVLAP